MNDPRTREVLLVEFSPVVWSDWMGAIRLYCTFAVDACYRFVHDNLPWLWPILDIVSLVWIDIIRLFAGRRRALGVDQCKRPAKPLILYESVRTELIIISFIDTSLVLFVDVSAKPWVAWISITLFIPVLARPYPAMGFSLTRDSVTSQWKKAVRRCSRSSSTVMTDSPFLRQLLQPTRT